MAATLTTCCSANVFESRHLPPPPASLVGTLAAHYGEPHRAYHNVAHITSTLRWFDWVWDEAGWDGVPDVYAAVLFHDVIYDPTAKDNELRSAELATAHGTSPRTHQLIMLTARHGSLARSDVDRDAAHFLDCDTAILGSEPAAFDAYDAAIRREYGAIPDVTFMPGRARFLAGMLERPRIFLSDLFHAKLDAAARENLARTVDRYRI